LKAKDIKGGKIDLNNGSLIVSNKDTIKGNSSTDTLTLKVKKLKSDLQQIIIIV
jgi:hypothetical protein